MELHLIIKIVHMSSVALLIVAFLLRASKLLLTKENDAPIAKGSKALIGLQHLSLTLIVLTGVTLLIMNDLQVQPWFYAKIILFLVMISSLIKAYKTDEHILLVQREAGLVISGVALAAIIALVMIKPVFG